VAEKQSIQPKKWHFEVSVSDSVAEEIANVALRERADLVAMFARDRRGIITRLLPGSLSEKVKDKVPIEVRTFSPDELRATGSHIGG
jgi:nucleotide-binding universal stress UspA family protein